MFQNGTVGENAGVPLHAVCRVCHCDSQAIATIPIPTDSDKQIIAARTEKPLNFGCLARPFSRPNVTYNFHVRVHRSALPTVSTVGLAALADVADPTLSQRNHRSTTFRSNLRSIVIEMTSQLPRILSRIIPMMIDHRDVVGVTELANSSSRLVADAADGRNVVISKNNKMMAMLISIDRVQELEDREENLALLSLAITRMATDNGNRTDLDDFISELGFTDEVAALEAYDEDDEVA